MAEENSLRVATWNLWWRHGDWESRKGPVIETLRAIDADLIALQEVSSSEPDQLALVRDELGFNIVAGPDGAENRFSVVNAIASRWPITDSEWLFLDVGEMPPHRTLVRATVASPGGPIDVYCTHLSHGFDQSGLRRRQLRQIAAYVAEHRTRTGHEYPPLLLGDLNATPDSDEIRMLTGRAAAAADGLVFTDAWERVGTGEGATYSEQNANVRDSAWPERRLDYVLVGWPRQRPLGNPIRAELFGTEAIRGRFGSDHFGVVAELRAGERQGE